MSTEQSDDALASAAMLAPSAREAIETAIDAGLPYVGLRGHAVDATLFHYLPLSLALEQCVAPLLLIGDSLTVASRRSDPDLGLLARRFPKLDVELVISAESEIRSLLDDSANAPPGGPHRAPTEGSSL